jgi:hypothetical protein
MPTPGSIAGFILANLTSLSPLRPDESVELHLAALNCVPDLWPDGTTNQKDVDDRYCATEQPRHLMRCPSGGSRSTNRAEGIKIPNGPGQKERTRRFGQP